MNLVKRLEIAEKAKVIIKKDLRMVGMIPCPECGKGLSYSLSQPKKEWNDMFHIDMKCETKNCCHYVGSL